MRKEKAEWKVGLFVIISLGAMTAAVIQFSKGTPLFSQTFHLGMRVADVGGVIPGAAVQMAGVPIGQVTDTRMDPDGRSVTILLEILEKYKIHGDAVFAIRQSGILGDRYISVTATENQKPILTDGAEIQGEEPLNLEGVARTAAGLILRVDDIVKTLNTAIARIDQLLLNEQTLTNLSGLVENFNRISWQSLATLDSLNQFVETNTQPLSATVANLEAFSGQLNTVATELHHMVATNRTDIRDAIQSIESATHQISLLSSDLQDGKGMVGSLLKNETLKEDFLETLHNLGSLSSNLSRHGLLWKPRLPKPPSSTAVYTGRNPLR